MTIPNGSPSDFYHISMAEDVTNLTRNVSSVLRAASALYNATTTPLAYSSTVTTSTSNDNNNNSSQWLEVSPFEAGASSISSYNVDTASGGGGGGVGAPGRSFVEATHKEFVYDRMDVRVVFITLYSLVFCCCFFGNLLVILVVTLSRRLRSITNFFLANLAVADLCVGVFCVMQNLSIYLITSWVFGDFLCKMYQFVHSLSSTASIFILVVICMERYFAIIHPITCKQTLTSRRLRLVIVGVWITSAIYSLPKFMYVHTVSMHNYESGTSETICVPNRTIYNSEVFDMINFGLLYCTPLLVMTLLYSRIAITLWKSSRQLDYCIPMQSVATSSSNGDTNHAACSRGGIPGGARGGGIASIAERNEDAETVEEADQNGGGAVNGRLYPVPIRDTDTSSGCDLQQYQQQQSDNSNNLFVQHKLMTIPHSSYNILRARRGVIRMLIVVVLTFALCNLPFHARKIWQYWSKDYRGDSNFNALFTPLTFLVTYFNSGVNPLLYAFLSRNFRNGIQEVFQCVFKRKKKNGSSSFQRATIPIHSMATETNLM